MSRPMKLGDRIRDNRGRVLVVVDRFQKRQKHGSWISPHDIFEVSRANFQDWVWGEDVGWPRAEAADAGFNDGYLCLCAEDELDEQENEFGRIMP